jgi:hypothetical protein
MIEIIPVDFSMTKLKASYFFTARYPKELPHSAQTNYILGDWVFPKNMT